MKLVLITAIEEYEIQVKLFLKNSGVKSYSVQTVMGFHNQDQENTQNWFASEDVPTNSVLFTILIQEHLVNEIHSLIEKFNQKQEVLSQIHFASLAIEQYM